MFPGTPNIKWAQELNIKADTYKVRNLFPSVTPSPTADIQLSTDHPEMCVYSPSEQFVYVVKILAPGAQLMTLYGKQRGSVMFNGPVLIPALHERCTWDKSKWEREPWMSHTPMEFISLRGGTRRAKGHVVIAGLGLGHQLIEVMHKKGVKEVTLVERSQELVDWLMPSINAHIYDTKVVLNTIVGDAHDVVPKLKADVALIDIWPRYGGNHFEACPNIPVVWCWGSQYAA